MPDMAHDQKSLEEVLPVGLPGLRVHDVESKHRVEERTFGLRIFGNEFIETMVTETD